MIETSSYLASDFLVAFFHSLDKEDIEYAVLRNSEGLPYQNSSKDIDILFREDSIERSRDLAHKIGADLGYKCIWRNDLDYLYGLVLVRQDEDKLATVKLDLFKGSHWRGFEFASTELLLSARQINSVYKLDSLDEAVVMVCYYSLYAKKIRKKYRERLLSTFSEKNFAFRFEQLTSLKWEHMSLNSESDWNNMCLNLNRRFRRKFAVSVLEFPSFINSCWLEYVLRTRFGAFLSVSGFDGCGKSSLLDSLNLELHSLGITDREVPDHLLSSQVPAPHQLFKRTKRITESSYDKPYSLGEVGYVQSLIRMAYYFFAFSIDRLIRFWRMRRNTLVIYDRYVIDFLVDPSRFRINRVPGLSYLFRVFIKKNHIKIVVLTDPVASVERKNELTIEKAESLYNSYLEMAEKFPSTVVFFNNSDLKSSRMSFNKLVFEALEKHYESM